MLVAESIGLINVLVAERFLNDISKAGPVFFAFVFLGGSDVSLCLLPETLSSFFQIDTAINSDTLTLQAGSCMYAWL